jgi:hypothetical protein
MSAPSVPIVTDDTPLVLPSTTYLYWQSPITPGNSALSSYTLTCPSISFSKTVPVPERCVLVSSLSDGVSYDFSLTATNSSGLTSSPAPFYPLQTGAPPGSPSNFTFTRLTSNAIFFQWSTPTTNGGSAITYNAFWAFPMDAQSNILSNLTTSSIKEYTNGNENNTLIYFSNTSCDYRFIIRSINSCGWSPNTPSLYSTILFNFPLPSSTVFFTNYNTGTNELSLTNFQTSNLSTQTITNTGFSYNYPNTNTSIIRQVYLNSTNTVSFACSAFLRSYGDYPSFLFFRNATTPASGLNLFQSLGRLSYHWADESGTNNFNTNYILPSSTWIHLVLTIAPTQAKWYVNTSSVVTYNYTHRRLDLSNCYFGQDPAIGARTLRGLIDNVGFFSTTLTQEEVSNLYWRSQIP